MTGTTRNDVLDGAVVDVRKVLELEVRRPLSLPASSLVRGRRAEGERSGKW